MVLQVYGAVDWALEFTEWAPPDGFTVTQLAGPFDEFTHRHTFRNTGDGTIISDRAHYKGRLGPIASFVDGPMLVEGRLAAMLAERSAILDRYLAGI